MEPTLTTRSFIHFGRAWYARHNNRLDGMIDVINFGEWHSDGSGDGACMTWYAQGPRLECFNDGWFVLAGMGDLISTLGNLNGYDMTPIEFCELLLALGFEDRTPADPHSNTIAPLHFEPSGITHRIVTVADLLIERTANAAVEARLSSAVVEPLFSIGERVFYYAPWGDVLDSTMGEGWYVGEVSEPLIDAARVGFIVQDGEIIERTIVAGRLRTKLHEGTTAQNAACRTTGEECYYHSSDYGWLKVKVDSVLNGHAWIRATHGDEVLIDGGNENPIPLAELHDGLPADTLAFNEPIVAQRMNGQPSLIICPNCEVSVRAVTCGEPGNRVTCWQCHFIFIRPA